ncbi:MAG: VTT domain-containing protein [Halapricum sp.]
MTETTGSVRGLVAARLIPLPADGVSYASGLADIPLRQYVLATAVGETPWVVTTVIAGGSMRAFTLDSTGVSTTPTAARRRRAGTQVRISKRAPPWALSVTRTSQSCAWAIRETIVKPSPVPS